MERFKRILVSVGQLERCSHLLACVRCFAGLVEAADVHLLHVAGDGAQDSDAGASEEADAGKTLLDRLSDLASEYFGGQGRLQSQCHVVQGTELLEVLRFAHDNDVDLIVLERHVGRQHETDEEALLARRITRKATCSVLVLAEDREFKTDTILVPVRNSDCSAAALEAACAIAAVGKATVITHNVYQVGAGYARVGTSLEEHTQLVEVAAKRESQQLLERADTGKVDVRCRYSPDLTGDPVPAILDTISTESADMLIIGARGRTGAAGVLLGTVTEQLIRQSPVPVLAIKKKGECIGIVRALITLAGEA